MKGREVHVRLQLGLLPHTVFMLQLASSLATEKRQTAEISKSLFQKMHNMQGMVMLNSKQQTKAVGALLLAFQICAASKKLVSINAHCTLTVLHSTSVQHHEGSPRRCPASH